MNLIKGIPITFVARKEMKRTQYMTIDAQVHIKQIETQNKTVKGTYTKKVLLACGINQQTCIAKNARPNFDVTNLPEVKKPYHYTFYTFESIQDFFKRDVTVLLDTHHIIRFEADNSFNVFNDRALCIDFIKSKESGKCHEIFGQRMPVCFDIDIKKPSELLKSNFDKCFNVFLSFICAVFGVERECVILTNRT